MDRNHDRPQEGSQSLLPVANILDELEFPAQDEPLGPTEVSPPVRPPAQQPETTPDEEPHIITLQRIPVPDNSRRRRIMLARARQSNKWFQAIPHGIDIYMQQSNMQMLSRFASALEKEAADMVGYGYNPAKLECLKTATRHIVRRSQEISAWVTTLWEELHELDSRVASAHAAAAATAPDENGAAAASSSSAATTTAAGSGPEDRSENEVHRVAVLGGGLRLVKEQTEQSFDLLEQILQDNEGGVLPAVQYCKFLEALFIDKMFAEPGESL
ncbi:electron carrier [Hypoxylon texense]